MSFKSQFCKKSGLLLSASVLALVAGIVTTDVSADEATVVTDSSVPAVPSDATPVVTPSSSGSGATDNTTVPSTPASDNGETTAPSTPASDTPTVPSSSSSPSEATPTTVTEGTTATNTQPAPTPAPAPTQTASQALAQGQSQIGTISESTGQVVSNVSYDNPVVTSGNETIVGTIDGQYLQILDPSTGTVTTKSISEVPNAKANEDGTISVTDKDGKKVTLPNTGDRVSFLLALLGTILVGFGLLKLPKRQVQQNFLI